MSATREEWDVAWKQFNGGVKLLRELCIKDGVTLKLTLPKLGTTKNSKATARDTATEQTNG